MPDVRIVAVAEIDPELRRQALALAPHATAFDRCEDLLDTSELDAVVICLPNALHADAAIAALEKGKHVYLEKPLATNLADARRVLQAWVRTGLVGMIGFNYRFNPLYRKLGQQIRAGRIGKVIAVRSVFSTPRRQLPGWKLARRTGGGALLDLASHHADLVAHLIGDAPREVFARVWSRRSEHDTANLEIALAGGVVAQSFFSLSSTDEDRIEIYGEEGKLLVDRYRSLDVEISDPTLGSFRFRRLGRTLNAALQSRHLLAKLRSPAYEPSFESALLHFANAARLRQPARPDFDDGYRSLEIIEAAEESARRNSPVALRGEPSALVPQHGRALCTVG
jgi:predicted dehydrogenase